MLEALNLRKSFVRSLAVDDVTFSAGGGEILGLIGPNGAGKTTTLRIILNILKPDSGSVLYHHNPFSERIRNSVGYLPEERGLYRKSRLLDTILYFAQLRGLKRPHARAEAMKWLKVFGLDDHSRKRIEELSKGNQQKVQFVLAVVHDPWLVILDEPFSGLDPVSQLLMQETITSLRHEGKCIILSTHQMEYAERMSDRICLLNEGKVLLLGAIAELKKRGSRTVRLGFEGEVTVLEGAPGIGRVTPSRGGAECELRDEEDMQELLVFLAQRVKLKRFELVEPSLQSIFLSAIRRGNR